MHSLTCSAARRTSNKFEPRNIICQLGSKTWAVTKMNIRPSGSMRHDLSRSFVRSLCIPKKSYADQSCQQVSCNVSKMVQKHS
jgi:hypothetical protein